MPWAWRKTARRDPRPTGRRSRFRNTIAQDDAAGPEPKRARPSWAVTQKNASILRRLATELKRGKSEEVANGTTSQ